MAKLSIRSRFHTLRLAMSTAASIRDNCKGVLDLRERLIWESDWWMVLTSRIARALSTLMKALSGFCSTFSTCSCSWDVSNWLPCFNQRISCMSNSHSILLWKYLRGSTFIKDFHKLKMGVNLVVRIFESPTIISLGVWKKTEIITSIMSVLFTQ